MYIYGHQKSALFGCKFNAGCDEMNADGFECGDLLGGILHIVSHLRACALFKMSTYIAMNVVAANNTQGLIGNSSKITNLVWLNQNMFPTNTEC